MYKCSKCTRRLNEDKGCVFCEDFKSKYLTIEDDNLDIKATKVGNRALKAVSGDLAKLQTELDADPKYNAVLSREVQIVVKNLTMLMESIRKIEKQGDDEKEASFSEQVLIFEDWLSDLPIMLRNEVLRKLEAKYATVLKAVK